MASKALLIALVVIASIAVPALSTEFVVGDDNGWKNNNYDYKAWAQGKDFHVGDKLIFKYAKGAHNVVKVDQKGFQECKAAENSTKFENGNDEITIKAPAGKKWYICSIGNHCAQGGMKLVIDTQDAIPAPAPSPSAPSPDTSASAFVSATAKVVAFGVAMIFAMFMA